MSNLSKEHAVELFLWICKHVYTNHRKLRTYLGEREMNAFHIIYMRLDEIGREFAACERYLGLSFHPWYPVAKTKMADTTLATSCSTSGSSLFSQSCDGWRFYVW